MSKTIVFKYETAHYDNASLATNPPTYPVTLEQYRVGAAATVANSYGTQTINGTGNVVLSIPTGATILMLPSASNTTPVALLQGTGVSLVPSGATGSLTWAAAPSQPVTLPGVLNQSTLSIQGVNASNLVPNSTAFTCTLVWWL